jgi:hypothetical protein
MKNRDVALRKYSLVITPAVGSWVSLWFNMNGSKLFEWFPKRKTGPVNGMFSRPTIRGLQKYRIVGMMVIL